MKKFYTVTLEIEAASQEAVESMLSRTLNDQRLMSFEIVAEDEEKKARIAYDKPQDMYKLMLSTDGGDSWDFSTGSQCRRCAEDEKDAEPMFVHIGLIEEMKKAIRCGFRIVY
ncbi:MAG: hypothetical protein J6W82_05160 [Bacteroidales bacterium]|nr:hypothetical protein [Bacteroidales bacterium]